MTRCPHAVDRQLHARVMHGLSHPLPRSTSSRVGWWRRADRHPGQLAAGSAVYRDPRRSHALAVAPPHNCDTLNDRAHPMLCTTCATPMAALPGRRLQSSAAPRDPPPTPAARCRPRLGRAHARRHNFATRSAPHSSALTQRPRRLARSLANPGSHVRRNLERTSRRVRRSHPPRAELLALRCITGCG